MKVAKILTVVIICAMFTFGIGGTSSAATLSNDLSTLQVENQELAARHPVQPHRFPPPPPTHRPSHDDRHPSSYGRTDYESSYGGRHRDGYESSYGGRHRGGYESRNTRGGNNSRQINVNVRKVTIKV